MNAIRKLSSGDVTMTIELSRDQETLVWRAVLVYIGASATGTTAEEALSSLGRIISGLVRSDGAFVPGKASE